MAGGAGGEEFLFADPLDGGCLHGVLPVVVEWSVVRCGCLRNVIEMIECSKGKVIRNQRSVIRKRGQGASQVSSEPGVRARERSVCSRFPEAIQSGRALRAWSIEVCSTCLGSASPVVCPRRYLGVPTPPGDNAWSKLPPECADLFPAAQTTQNFQVERATKVD